MTTTNIARFVIEGEEVPDATETVKGKVQLATDLETTAGKAMQGSDSRGLGGSANANAAAPIDANRGPVRISQGSGITVGYTFTSGIHEFTITASGAAFPGFETSAPNIQPDGVAASVGSTSLAPHSDHVHPPSADNDVEFTTVTVKIQNGTGGSGAQTSPYNVFTNHISGVMRFADNTFVTNVTHCRFSVSLPNGWSSPGGQAWRVQIDTSGILSWTNTSGDFHPLYAVVSVFAKKNWRNTAVTAGSLTSP